MEGKRVVVVNSFDHRLLVGSLTDYRNVLLRESRPTEDVDRLLLRVIDAPARRDKWKADREGR